MSTPTPSKSPEWFKVWFNSPYYSILYKNRDVLEAQGFIDHLLGYLQPPARAHILDLACGKGRHARYLADLGFYVTGIDIAENSIQYARQFENERLAFFTHDMRQPFRINYFDYIFNIFTSFGYFARRSDHLRSLENIAKGLRPEGIFMMDFFNAEKVIRELQPQETRQVDQYEFQIQRKVQDGYVLKEIRFEAEGREQVFTERVRAFQLSDLEVLFAQAGLQIQTTFGNYQLEPFDPDSSDRLILLAGKQG